MGVFSFFLSLAIPLFLAFVFLPRTLRFLGELLGRYLQRSSQTRRELLLSRVANEQRAYESGHKDSRKKEDDDWEEIEGATVGSAINGGKADSDWRGIVGFFHPFW